MGLIQKVLVQAHYLSCNSGKNRNSKVHPLEQILRWKYCENISAVCLPMRTLPESWKITVWIVQIMDEYMGGDFEISCLMGKKPQQPFLLGLIISLCFLISAHHEHVFQCQLFVAFYQKTRITVFFQQPPIVKMILITRSKSYTGMLITN